MIIPYFFEFVKVYSNYGRDRAEHSLPPNQPRVDPMTHPLIAFWTEMWYNADSEQPNTHHIFRKGIYIWN